MEVHVMSKDKKEPFSKVSDLQHWLGMSENGIRLYEKEGIITPGRNKENGYRQLNISDGDKMFQSRIYTGYGFSLRETADMLGTADFDSQYNSLEKQEDQLQEEMLLMAYKSQYLNRHLKLLREMKKDFYSVRIVPGPDLAFLPVHDQSQIKAAGESDCAAWLSQVPFVRSAVLMKMGEEPYQTVWFGPVTEWETAMKCSLPMENAVRFGSESPQYVTGFTRHGIDDFPSEKNCGHLTDYAGKQGYICGGTLLTRHLMLVKGEKDWIHYDQIWIPVKKE